MNLCIYTGSRGRDFYAEVKFRWRHFYTISLNSTCVQVWGGLSVCQLWVKNITHVCKTYPLVSTTDQRDADLSFASRALQDQPGVFFFVFFKKLSTKQTCSFAPNFHLGVGINTPFIWPLFYFSSAAETPIISGSLILSSFSFRLKSWFFQRRTMAVCGEYQVFYLIVEEHTCFVFVLRLNSSVFHRSPALKLCVSDHMDWKKRGQDLSLVLKIKPDVLLLIHRVRNWSE